MAVEVFFEVTLNWDAVPGLIPRLVKMKNEGLSDQEISSEIRRSITEFPSLLKVRMPKNPRG